MIPQLGLQLVPTQQNSELCFRWQKNSTIFEDENFGQSISCLQVSHKAEGLGFFYFSRSHSERQHSMPSHNWGHNAKGNFESIIHPFIVKLWELLATLKGRKVFMVNSATSKIEFFCRSEGFQKSAKIDPKLKFDQRCLEIGDRQFLADTQKSHFYWRNLCSVKSWSNNQ